jgi:peptidoglycan hydrolase CwlO-like protein
LIEKISSLTSKISELNLVESDTETIIRDLDQSNTALAKQRDELRAANIDLERRLAGTEGKINALQATVKGMEDTMLDAVIRAARAQGYAYRVREQDRLDVEMEHGPRE